MMMTRITTLAATLTLMPALALAAPKAGDDASGLEAARTYCGQKRAHVKSATYTSPTTIAVECATSDKEENTYYKEDIPEGAKDVVYEADPSSGINSGPSSGGEYRYTIPGVLFAAVILSVMGNGDSTSGTTP
jgi:hypothetical protein